MDSRIRHLNIEVTKRCNQRCFYCFNNSGLGAPSRELPVDHWLCIVRSLQQRGLESIHLTGGEPFAYKHAVELLAGAQSLGLCTSILSNGLRVPELSTAFPQVFRKLTVAQISLDSMNEQTHNARRGYPKAWQDAVSAIRALREIEVPVEVSCVVSQTNLGDLQMVAEFCEEVNAGLIIRPMIPAGRASSVTMPESFSEQLEICVHSLLENCGVQIVSDRFYYVADERNVPSVDSPDDIYTAHSDGRLRFCEPSEHSLLSLAV